MEEQEKIFMTEFDMKFQGNNLQLMKAMIPFIDIGQQRMMAIYIKFLEFSNTINYFKNNKNDVSICNTGDVKKNPLDMLNIIKDYCSKSQRETIEMMINLLNMLEMVNTYKDMMGNFDLSSFNNNGGEKGDDFNENSNFNINPMDMMKTMLTPEQQTMFDTYSTLLNASDTETQEHVGQNEGEFKENSNFNVNPMDMMKTMLTPEQQTMFDTYSALLNTSDIETQEHTGQQEGELDEPQ